MILVAEERLPDAQEQPRYLSPKPIVSRSLKGWLFGINRYLKPIVELVPSLDHLCSNGTWQASGHLLSVADLVSIPAQFVPADNGGSAPINRVLKKNFWSGSHVFEWVDTTKTRLKALFDDPPALQELSEAVRKYVPIGRASLSDPLIVQAFQNFSLGENGKPPPVECYFMRKREGEPGLEVADFIMRAIGRQARHNLTKRRTFVPDFAAVFHGIDTKRVSFIEVSSVVQNTRQAG
jgi:hypothetical protein